MRVRIKICGITNVTDAQIAVALGVDALGFVFVRQSARHVPVALAKSIIKQLPPYTHAVGLFMDQSHDEVIEITTQLHLSSLQFHGSESPGFCQGFSVPFVKSIPMNEAISPLDYAAQFPTASGILLDSHQFGGLGGQGMCFDWASIPQGFQKPLILAGGLTPDNIADAVALVRPYAVDVSSGVERGKGKKDEEKMRAFVQNVTGLSRGQAQ